MAADIDAVVGNLDATIRDVPDDDAEAEGTAYGAALPVTGEVAEARQRVDAWVEGDCS